MSYRDFSHSLYVQEHVSEYGVHWNFYFTLAGVYLVYSALQCLGKWATHPITATVILLGTFTHCSCDNSS